MSYDDWKLATPPEYDELGEEEEGEEEPQPEQVNREQLPSKCCMNVGREGFVSCDKPAAYWYRHNEDICSYCGEHDYQCGTPIEAVG